MYETTSDELLLTNLINFQLFNYPEHKEGIIRNVYTLNNL